MLAFSSSIITATRRWGKSGPTPTDTAAAPLLRLSELTARAECAIASVRALEGDASRRILDVDKHVLADVIVMGSRGHSTIGELLLGSVAHKVTMKADIPVMLVPIDR